MSTRQPQLSDLATSPAGLSYALDSSSSKFQIVPSRTNDLHKPLRAVEFASACRLPIPALPNLYLCAGCQCLRNRIPRQPQFPVLSSRQPIPLTSLVAWLGHFIVQPMFVNNLRCRFSFDEPTAAQIYVVDLCPCLAWLPAPLGTVLDSLPKCAPRAHLTLLHLSCRDDPDHRKKTQ
jgi:hypothetical protein